MLETAHRPGQARDDQDVTLAEVCQRGVELGPGRVLAAHPVVDEDPVAAVRLQLVDL